METSNGTRPSTLDPAHIAQSLSIKPQPPQPEIDQLASALAQAQSEFPAIVKRCKVDFVDKNGRRVKYNYADLADVLTAITPPLTKNGLAIIHQLMYGPGNMYGLKTTLVHKSGQQVHTWYPMPDPLKGEIRPQEFGSALTYGRRYSVSSLTGVASEDDDDGGSAPTIRPPQPQRPKAPAKTPNRQPPPRNPNELATDEMMEQINSLAIERSVQESELIYLITKGFGFRGSRPTVSIAREIWKMLSNEDCNSATIMAKATAMENERRSKEIVRESQSEEIPDPEPDHGPDLDASYPGDQVAKDPIDITWREYVIDFGKHTGSYLDDIGVLEGRKYLEWLEKDAKKNNRSLNERAEVFKFHYLNFAAEKAGEK